MNKSFLTAVGMLITSSIVFGLLFNDAISGLSIGTMISLLTFIFFEYCDFFAIKKTASKG